MITVDWRARRHLLMVLEHIELLEGATLRLQTLGGNDSSGRPEVIMCAGMQKGGDQTVEHRGDVLLRVDRMVSAAYDGCVLDVIQTPEGLRFSLAPPEVGSEAL